jgi:hypothetical protein
MTGGANVAGFNFTNTQPLLFAGPENRAERLLKLNISPGTADDGAAGIAAGARPQIVVMAGPLEAYHLIAANIFIL